MISVTLLIAISYIQSGSALKVVRSEELFSESAAGCMIKHCGFQAFYCQLDKQCSDLTKCDAKCSKDPKKLTLDAEKCMARCSDLYGPTAEGQNPRLEKLMKCAMDYCADVMAPSKIPDELKCHVPKNTLKVFDQALLEGKWYAARGYSFMDCHDCQSSDISIESNGAMKIHAEYKVRKDLKVPGQYVRTISADITSPKPQSNTAEQGHLEVSIHKNSIAVKTDWYMLAAKKDTYMLYYYCPCLNGQCGNPGAALLTRDHSFDKLDEADKTDIKNAIKASGIKKWSLDGMCSPSMKDCEEVGSS